MSKFPLRTSFHRLSPEPSQHYPCRMCLQPALAAKIIPLFIAALMALSGPASAGAPPGRSVSLTQDPLIMRLDKDEFRIAFGINGERCGANGCSGTIRYRVRWKSADGALRSETKRVSYTVPPLAPRTIAVDRQYFHTAEGRQMTDVVNVSIDAITCVDGADERRTSIERL